MGQIHGHIVGVPSCADPTTTGLQFTVKDDTRTVHCQVAGTAAPLQAPASALAMSMLAVSALAKSTQVVVDFIDDPIDGGTRHIATLVGIPAQAFPVSSDEKIAVPNPVTGTVISVQALDRNSKVATLAANIYYKIGTDSAYLQTQDQGRIPTWVRILVLAFEHKKAVTATWKGYRELTGVE